MIVIVDMERARARRLLEPGGAWLGRWEKRLDDAHWMNVRFIRVGLDGVGGATLGLGPKALRKSKRFPYERFVGMRLSDGRSGGCFQYTGGERAKVRRAVKHKTSEARRCDAMVFMTCKTRR